MEGVSQEVTQFYQASSGGERSDEERRNLAKARFMALDRYPVTDVANELCRVVGDYLINTDSKRKNKRGREALDRPSRSYVIQGIPRSVVKQWVVPITAHGQESLKTRSSEKPERNYKRSILSRQFEMLSLANIRLLRSVKTTTPISSI